MISEAASFFYERISAQDLVTEVNETIIVTTSNFSVQSSGWRYRSLRVARFTAWVGAQLLLPSS